MADGLGFDSDLGVEDAELDGASDFFEEDEDDEEDELPSESFLAAAL